MKESLARMLLIAGRELRAYVEQPFSWLLGALGLVPIGVYFGARTFSYCQASLSQEVAAYVDLDLHAALLAPFFEFTAFVLLLLTPLWTMRLIAEERRSNVLALLLSSPLQPGELVLGKFLGAAAYLAVFLVLPALMPVSLFLFGNPDVLTLVTGFVGLYLLGLVMLAVGLATSALVDHPLPAAALCLTILLVLLFLGNLEDPLGADLMRRAAAAPAVWNQAGRLWQGLVQLSDLAGLAGTTVFFLALARLRVDAATWR